MNDIPKFEDKNSANDSFQSEDINIPPVSTENADVQINVEEIPNQEPKILEQNNVNNFNNIENAELTPNLGVSSNNQDNFQPNYYGYQHSYQPTYQQYQADPKITQKYFEKTAVKKTSNRIGAGLLLFYGIEIVLSFILVFFMAFENIVDILEDPAFMLELNIIITVIGFLSAALLIFKMEKTKPQELISYGPPKKGTLLAAILVGVGFCYVANIVVSLLQSSLQGILPFAQTELELPRGGFGFALSVISVAVAPALIEEFLFRGAIMGNLLKFGKSFAIFTSAFLFALIHGNLVQIPFAFLVGLVLGFLDVETDSIWTGVIIHFLNNFISVCVDYLGDYVNENTLNVCYLIILAIFIIAGIIGIYILSIKNKNLFSFEKTKHLSTSYERFGWHCSSATIVIYFVLIGFSVLTTQLTANL